MSKSRGRGINYKRVSNTKYTNKNELFSVIRHECSSAVDEQQHHLKSIVGTSTDIEKPYFRLTSEANSSRIRPLHILKQSLSHVLELWRKRERKYLAICDQFRSIRQDLTVQEIRNEFSVEVYESNAIVCMEGNDPEELVKCIHMLASLYQDGQFSERKNEFLMYRILMIFYLNTIGEENSSLCQILQDPSFYSSKYFSFIRNLLSAYLLGNYCRFFQTCLSCPASSSLIIDMFIERERCIAFKKIIKAYRPKVSVSHITVSLGFPHDEACCDFIQRICPELDHTTNEISCRDAISYLSCKNQL